MKLPQCSHQLYGRPVDFVAVLRQCEAGATSFTQAKSETGFEHGEMGANRRAANAKPQFGGCEPSTFGDRLENAKQP